MRVRLIATGATASFFVVAAGDQTYMAGQTKKTGEANVYPKPIYDLSGWKPYSVASGNTSSAVAAEGGLITWGGAPTYGELGYGETEARSSTKPKLVDLLAGARVFAVACGFAATLALLDVSSADKEGEVGRQLVGPGPKALPVYVAPTVAAAKGAAAKVPAAAKAPAAAAAATGKRKAAPAAAVAKPKKGK